MLELGIWKLKSDLGAFVLKNTDLQESVMV